MNAPLRAVGAVTAYYLSVAVIALSVTLLIPPGWTSGLEGVLVPSVVLVVSASIVNWVLLRRGLARSEVLGWPARRLGARGFAVGLAVGAAMALVAVLLAVGPGGAHVERTADPIAEYVTMGLRVGGVLLAAALAEELLFRGYPLGRLAQAVGRVRASIALAAVFAVVHAFNPNVSVFGLVNIGLASLVLSGAFFTPGALPAAWGLHVGWNGGLSLGADAPVSGVTFEVPMLEFTSGGPEWFTGGAFGPEGGVVATVVMGLALACLMRMKLRPAVSER